MTNSGSLSNDATTFSGTQTKFSEIDEISQDREVIVPKSLSWADKNDGNYVTTNRPVAVATTGASTADVLTSTANETQTRNRDIEPKGEVLRIVICVAHLKKNLFFMY